MDPIDSVCRLCLKKDPGKGLQELFGQNLISMKIMSLFQLTLMQGLNWPHVVCAACVKKLDDVCTFRKEIIDNQILIEQQYGPVKLKQDVTLKIHPSSFVTENPTILHLHPIVINTAQDQEEEEVEEMIISDQLGELEHLEVVAEKDDCEATESSPRRTSKRSRIVKEPIVGQKPEKKLRSVTAAKKKNQEKTELPELKRLEVDDLKEDTLEEDVDDEGDMSDVKHYKYKDVDEEIRKFMTLSCNLCEATNFSTFPQLRSHYTKQHKVKGYVMCCNIKHLRRHKLYEHILFHIDPDTFKCSTCAKSFNSSHNLKIHTQMQHLPEEERAHQCEKCLRRFGTTFQLKQHLVTHITEEEKSFKCDDCSKMFPGRAHLLSHIRLVHENRKPFTCEICRHAFASQTYLKNHLAAIHEEQREKVKCEHCSKYFANQTSIKKHLSRLNVTGEKFICPECGHESPNKSALSGHIKRNHNENRSAFMCGTCGKQFKSQRTLTEHMAKHTGVLLYKCAFCSKQFNSNANKYSHQKKKHPAEWEKMNTKKLEGVA